MTPAEWQEWRDTRPFPSELWASSADDICLGTSGGHCCALVRDHPGPCDFNQGLVVDCR